MEYRQGVFDRQPDRCQGRHVGRSQLYVLEIAVQRQVQIRVWEGIGDGLGEVQLGAGDTVDGDAAGPLELLQRGVGPLTYRIYIGDGFKRIARGQVIDGDVPPIEQPRLLLAQDRLKVRPSRIMPRQVAIMNMGDKVLLVRAGNCVVNAVLGARNGEAQRLVAAVALVGRQDLQICGYSHEGRRLA